jgi:nucleotide-binding universal stress UspA family protein
MPIPSFTLRSIFHPTDFSQPSQVAFAHALKLALEAKAELRIMHVGMATPSSGEFPQVPETLTEWGLLPPGSAKNAVSKLGLQVEKVRARGSDPLKSILRYLERKPVDLIVLATHQRRGFARWMHEAMAERIAGQSGVMTLFVPPRSTGFVSVQDGSVNLRQIVIPVCRVPHPRSAVNAVIGLSQLVKTLNTSCMVMHVGMRDEMPVLPLPDGPGLTWTQTVQDGEVVEQILRSADEQSADLIAMATQGHKGFLDALRGSTTERIVREARCPVLAITT